MSQKEKRPALLQQVQAANQVVSSPSLCHPDTLGQGNSQGRLRTIREAANYLAISQRKLADLKATGEIPFIPIGRSIRFDVADLDRFIERQRSGGVE